MTFLIVLAFVGSASGVDVDFDAAQGYSPGNLFGQPSAGSQWMGDDSAKIQVTAALSEAGGQSARVDPNATTGKANDDLAIGVVPERFSLKFFWRPSGTSGGDATVYLAESQGATTNQVGPWVVFVGAGTVYQIKSVENGFVQNIKTGMDPLVYEDRWWEVEVVGDLSTYTFDFYLDGVLEKSDLGFRNTLEANRADSLNFLALQASTSGASDHYFDSVRIEADPRPAVPTGSAWTTIGLVGLLVGCSVWLMRRSAAAGAG